MRIQHIDGADSEFTEATIGLLVSHLVRFLLEEKNGYIDYRGHFILKIK
jgi:hypothetical protein